MLSLTVCYINANSSSFLAKVTEWQIEKPYSNSPKLEAKMGKVSYSPYGKFSCVAEDFAGLE